MSVLGRPGFGLAIVALVLGGAVGVGVGWAKLAARDDGRTPVTSSDAGSPIDAIDLRAIDSGSIDAREPSWADDLDAASPPPSSQTDQRFLMSLVDSYKHDESTMTLMSDIVAGRRHHANQGNEKIATHAISRAQCLNGLRDLVLQTPLQKEICGGPYEVPIHKGDPMNASTCIDIFEYPNHPCELPFVHTYGMQGEALCAMAGKRLCTDEEWDQACENDPNGGPPSKYAYGNEIDLSICNTGKPWPPKEGPVCRINDDLWNTCSTNTEPNGAFPKCRSRLGVFDLHGNVAEAMHRWQDGIDFVQLKGSAFFYDGKMYKDHCRFDPRWHVEEFNRSWHDNYHLGFRCCRSVRSMNERLAMANAATPPTSELDASTEQETLESIDTGAETEEPTPYDEKPDAEEPLEDVSQ